MNHYNRLRLSAFGSEEVALCFYEGKIIKGVIDICLTNEDWEEDGEKPALALLAEGKIVEYELENIDFIVRLNDVYAQAV